MRRQEGTTGSWLRTLPAELVRVRPVLSVEFAGVLLAGGELESAEADFPVKRAPTDNPPGAAPTPGGATDL